MLLYVWQDCKVCAAKGVAQCDESFPTRIPPHPVPSPVLPNVMYVLPCKKAGGFTKQMWDHCVLKVKDGSCSFQDAPPAGLLLTDLWGREGHTKYGTVDPILLVFPSLSQHRHFHFRPCKARQVEKMLWRLNKPVTLQVTTFPPRWLSYLFQDLSHLPNLIYQQKSNHHMECKSTCVLSLTPSSLVQIKN